MIKHYDTYPNERNMICPYSGRSKCDVWNENDVLRFTIQEATELSHENWTEIQNLYSRIDELEAIILSAGLELPE